MTIIFLFSLLNFEEVSVDSRRGGGGVLYCLMSVTQSLNTGLVHAILECFLLVEEVPDRLTAHFAVFFHTNETRHTNLGYFK